MSLYERYTYDDGQIIFNRILFAFIVVIKIVLKAIVYSPLLLLSWITAKQILDAKTDVILWIALILVFTTIFYFMIYFLKGVLIALNHNHNFIWIPVFICCALFTCVLPVWLVFEPLEKIVTSYAQSNQHLLTWIFALAFGLYVYSKYHFLTNIVPILAYPYYQRGINLTIHLLNFSNTFKAKKSHEFV